MRHEKQPVCHAPVHSCGRASCVSRCHAHAPGTSASAPDALRCAPWCVMAFGLVVGLAAGITAVMTRRTEVIAPQPIPTFGAPWTRDDEPESVVAGGTGTATRTDRQPVAVVGQRHRPDAGCRQRDRSGRRPIPASTPRCCRPSTNRRRSNAGSSDDARQRSGDAEPAMTPRPPRSSRRDRAPDDDEAGPRHSDSYETRTTRAPRTASRTSAAGRAARRPSRWRW